LCDDEARAPDEETALAPPSGAAKPSGARPTAPARDERVRYRPCPACGELMNRDNFGRVSGVILDVCRPHGAWLDRGELAAIRRFLRQGGARRFERSRALDEERAARRDEPPLPSPSPHLAEVLLGGDASFDVPSRLPMLPIAIVCAGLGAWLTWSAFAGDAGEPGLAVGLGCLVLAWGAARRWLDRRGR
jgi:Zn-finger nucleic acid-binding protein